MKGVTYLKLVTYDLNLLSAVKYSYEMFVSFVY